MNRPVALPMRRPGTPNDKRPLISVSQAAALAGVSRSMAYMWSRTRTLPGLVEINRRLYVRRAIFERWLVGADQPFEKRRCHR
jgi:predicted DNA-binding transcriptional regulator AlpA